MGWRFVFSIVSSCFAVEAFTLCADVKILFKRILFLTFSSSSRRSICRLSRERISELQQQVEDLQKALQSQAAKPDDVSVPRALAPIQRKCPNRVNLIRQSVLA